MGSYYTNSIYEYMCHCGYVYCIYVSQIYVCVYMCKQVIVQSCSEIFFACIRYVSNIYRGKTLVITDSYKAKKCTFLVLF